MTTGQVLGRSLFRAALVASLWLDSRPGVGQAGPGVIEGRVLAAEGVAVAGTVVTARHIATGFRQSAITDAQGAYRIEGLPAGTYDVTAEAPNFATGLTSGVVVREGIPGAVDFALKTVVIASPAPPVPPVALPVPPPQGQGGAVPAVPLRTGPRMEIYGFAQLDLIYDFDQVNPDWFDVERPTKLPAFPNEFGQDGNFWASVRQTRFGVKGWLPTDWGEVKTQFDFDLFGVGANAGQTTFRLQHAFGELGPFLAGQTESVFMDLDVFPLSIEYWGPNGMVFFRNVQLRWAPLRGDNEIFIGLERPGASADAGVIADRVEIGNIRGHFPAPDLTMHYRRNGDWGHFQLSGIVRYIGWTDTLQDQFDLSGHTVGWGIHGSTNLRIGKTGVVRASVIYGEGVENYMNDAPVDVGAQTHLGNPRRPVDGKALPVLGIVGFYDFNWSEKFTSAIGYSRVHIDNSDLQAPVAFKTGQYALANILYYPVKNVMTGFEFLWGRRTNDSDGFSVNDFRLQFSARYTFSYELGGK